MPFDLYSSNGTLLARRGAQLDSDSAPVLSRRLFRSRQDGEQGGEKALERLQSLYSDYERLTQEWSCAAEDVQRLKALAAELIELCTTHSDVCVGMAAYLSGHSHARRHCFAAAVVGVLLACSLGWNDRLAGIARAALTMNLSQLAYHDELAVIRGYLSAIQEKNMRCHPRLSAELLAKSPGTDTTWIAAVAQHHENLDGSGYPFGLKREEIIPEARVLRVADTWCALVFQKQGKGKKTPSHALELLSASSRAHLDYEIVLTLKKLMGAYPPGTFVRLANRETALVTSWDRNGAMPGSVLSVISPSGEIRREFHVRDARRLDTRVRDYTHLDLAQMSRLPWSRLWSQGARPAAND